MADVLKYGDKVHLVNGWDDWKGGYLDTNGGSTATGAKYGVSTTPTPTRGQGTGTWEITSVAGKAVGAEVISGDAVYLRNLYGGDGGYLDTNGGSTLGGGAKYAVSTSPAKDRGAGTGRWRVFAETSNPVDLKVRAGDRVHLLNGWDDWNGGFLDTNSGSTATGAKYGVSTSLYSERGTGTGVWKFSKATA